MYSIANYGAMIAHRARMDAYAQALREAIREDSVVLDIGTGTGIFTLLACQFGARHVYAIEYDDAICVARQLADAQGFTDRITFIQDRSDRISLPEQVDVIVSDMRGALPLFNGHIPSILDARTRFLKPGGHLVPLRDTLYAAVISAADQHAQIVTPWRGEDYGLDLQIQSRYTVNQLYKVDSSLKKAVGEQQPLGLLDYPTIASPHFSGAATWVIPHDIQAHGLCVWFDSAVSARTGFSNAPDRADQNTVYGQSFFPWPSPVLLDRHDTVSVTIGATLSGGDYVWQWHTQIFVQGDPARVKTEFKQSTFLGAPYSAERLKKRSDHFVPHLNEEGEIARLFIAWTGESLALGAMARRLFEAFPKRFKTWHEALTEAGDLSNRYSQ